MRYRRLDDTASVYAWWSSARAEHRKDSTPAVEAPVDARGASDGLKASGGTTGERAPEVSVLFEDEPDFSEEFGPGEGFAGGSGFAYGEFERWV